MLQYDSSKLLKTIIKQADIINVEPQKQYEVNRQYQPPNLIQPQISGNKSTENIFDYEIKPPSDPNKGDNSTQVKIQKPQSPKPEYPFMEIPPIIEIKPIEEYSHMRPVILGEIQEENKKSQKTFLQALRDGNCIIQLPNKLPFHDIGKTQKYIEEVKGDLIQKQLKDYYDECYDSSGIQLQKQFTNLSNKADIGIHIGKISISADGTSIWKAGREEFEIVQGITQDLDQKCLIINKEDGKCGFVNVGDKFIINPNY